jgi:hypothetical protein
LPNSILPGSILVLNIGMPDSHLIGFLEAPRYCKKRAEPADWEAISNDETSRPGNERCVIDNLEGESLVPSLIPSGNQSNSSVVGGFLLRLQAKLTGLTLLHHLKPAAGG